MTYINRAMQNAIKLALKAVDYEKMRTDLAKLKLPQKNASGFAVWVGNTYTMNSSSINPVAQWVGLPLDAAKLEKLTDILTDNGSEEYTIADVSVPSQNMHSTFADMSLEDANYFADQYVELSPQDKITLAAVMASPDLANNYDIDRLVEAVGDGEIYTVDDIGAFIEENLQFFDKETLIEFIVGQANYDHILFVMSNDNKMFNYENLGADKLLIYPFDL